jgi:GMP synthase-like glutamine amidotransferase
MINKEFGGSVIKKDAREDGQYTVDLENRSRLFKYARLLVLELLTLTPLTCGFEKIS